MASVFKPEGARKYIIQYHDEHGRRRKKTGATDKGVTERIARDLENRVALRREGLIDPAAETHAANESRPLAEHLDAFHAHLIAKGGTAAHANLTRNRVAVLTALIRGAAVADVLPPSNTRAARERASAIIAGHLKATRLTTLTLSRVQSALKRLTDAGRSLESHNHYVRSVKAFSRWAWRDGRAREHVLAHLATRNPEPDRRHPRRALTSEEAARLIQAAESGPAVRGMTGPDRAMLYRVAMATGLRADELRSLTPEAFRLDATPPQIVCAGAYTKNGRLAEQPIPEALAGALRPWLATKPAAAPVFAAMPKLRTAAMIRADLETAGIPYQTDSGAADFHALRGTYISELVRSGASVKTCQVLARHSTPSLTIGIYAKASVHDLTGAVESLPDLTGPTARPEAAALRATGTDGSVPTATESATALETDAPKLFVVKEDASIVERIANPLSPGSNPGGASCDNRRQTTPSPDKQGAWRFSLVRPSSGQMATRTDTFRPLTATENATRKCHGRVTVRDGKDARNQAAPPPDRLISPRAAVLESATAPPAVADEDLTRVIEAWPTLPEAIRAGILAMVQVARK